MTPSLYLCLIPWLEYTWNKDVGMVSRSCVCACCVMTPCFFFFGAQSHPYIPIHFEETIFPLVLAIFLMNSLHDGALHGKVKEHR